MKVEKLVGERFKERPSDCVIDSHVLMVRGGYIKYVASGIFSQYTPLRRVARNIERIIREEMDAIDGQEVQFPVVLPASLWQESGRFESVGPELMRFKDRNGSGLVLGMTHEEAAVQLVREYGNSYTKYPFMIYQLQTKFRDEARPRGGLIRVREFMMKDAYSFHTSQEDLESYYDRCLKAYERIFERVGLPEVISVAADSGMMGGSLSHEFMLLTPVGEDSIAVCPECGYRANREAAECIVENSASQAEASIERVATPNIHTIEELCGHLNLPPEKTCKAVVYQKVADGGYVVLFIRGDLDANETKLVNYTGEDIRPAEIADNSGLNAGYIGPYDLRGEITVLYDRSLKGAGGLACGANENGYHYVGLDIVRDCGEVEYRDFAKIADGGICPKCGKHSINVSRGIEVGNIFQLGDKYTHAMDMRYLDENGELKYPVMGCYGIGVGRLAAAVCEARHDDFGPIWPKSIAPWQAHVCCVRADDSGAREFADGLYEELLKRGIEALYDDRQVSAGVMFSDADLLGAPLRVVVSPRNMKEGCVELISRDKETKLKVMVDAAVDEIEKLI